MDSTVTLPPDYRPSDKEEYMNDMQLEYFRQKLLSWKKSLIGQSMDTLDDLKQGGVYFLFGTSNEIDKGVVYIGNADDGKNGEEILNRLQEHKRNLEKDYWIEAIIFTTSKRSIYVEKNTYEFMQIIKH